MFTILDDFPDDVLAISATGKIEARDYDAVLVPALEDKLRRHRPLKVFIWLGPGYAGIKAGAVVEDIRIGLHHLKDWGRIAVVTDAAGMRDMVNLVRMFLKRPLRVFFNADYDKAKAWICMDEADAKAAAAE
jgi:hypothetical protein